MRMGTAQKGERVETGLISKRKLLRRPTAAMATTSPANEPMMLSAMLCFRMWMRVNAREGRLTNDIQRLS
jgi:hypothetical protein